MRSCVNCCAKVSSERGQDYLQGWMIFAALSWKFHGVIVGWTLCCVQTCQFFYLTWHTWKLTIKAYFIYLNCFVLMVSFTVSWYAQRSATQKGAYKVLSQWAHNRQAKYPKNSDRVALHNILYMSLNHVPRLCLIPCHLPVGLARSPGVYETTQPRQNSPWRSEYLSIQSMEHGFLTSQSRCMIIVPIHTPERLFSQI